MGERPHLLDIVDVLSSLGSGTLGDDVRVPQPFPGWWPGPDSRRGPYPPQLRSLIRLDVSQRAPPMAVTWAYS